ncbi:MAG: hypothetical protein K2X87_03600 [Gemmataceae bacterium]|nr:hypothetical protein [Gemmataceae bacterium]
MNALTRPAGWAIVAVAAFGVGHGRADDKPKPAEPEKKPTVMQRKLAHAQKVLEGLATEDYDLIGKNADGLIACVKDATWKIGRTDQYLLLSNDFTRGAEGLKKAAKEKKVDAAALAYVDLTLTCVKCHRYLRDEGITLAPDPARRRAAD